MFAVNPRDVIALGRQLDRLGIHPGHLALTRILERIGDADLALTALVMRPRPAWVAEIAGPLD